MSRTQDPPRTERRRHGLSTVLALVLLAGALTGCATKDSPSGTGPGQHGYKIAYANSQLGNTFHQVLIKQVRKTASQGKAQGLVSKFTISDANGSLATQAQQIRNFIIEGYDAIIVDAGSATGLNGAIKQACDAGITVVAVNESVTAPCAYNVGPNWPQDTIVQMEYFAKVFHGHANILDVRGLAGTLSDTQMQQGIDSVVHKNPGLKIVGTVYGNWTETVAHQVVAQALPSLPSIQAVVTQGGDEAGIIQAFRAAHRPVPQVVFGNRGNELQIWAGILKRQPNYGSFSLSDWPGGVESFGFWTTVALLEHKVPKLSKDVWFPLSKITTKTLPNWLKVTPAQSVASRSFSYNQSLQLLRLEPNVPNVITSDVTGPILQTEGAS